jgi:3-deoxy-manno-octulosonate cytidylyltransferase (CMP-KDO synthetase)
MIQHVWERVSEVLPTFVATDDERIAQVIEEAGGMAILTSENCQNGTQRVTEALHILSEQGQNLPGIVLNIQGDEPLVSPHDIVSLLNLMLREEVQIGTLVTPAKPGDAESGTNAFADKTPDGRCHSFSRNPACCSIQAWRHVGMYGFKTHLLPELVALPATDNEVRERLEQVRWIDHGYAIYAAEVKAAGIGVDSPEDLEKVRGLFS